MNDQDLLKGAVYRRAYISLHDHAIEVFAIAVGIASREVIVDRDHHFCFGLVV